MTRLDLRLAKRIRLSSRVGLQGNFNIYNVFNGAAVNVLNTNYGPRWQRAVAHPGRPHAPVQRVGHLLTLQLFVGRATVPYCASVAVGAPP